MPFYLAWIYSNFSCWNFKFFSISDLSYGTNQDFMPFILAQFFVARYPKKLHSEKAVKNNNNFKIGWKFFIAMKLEMYSLVGDATTGFCGLAKIDCPALMGETTWVTWLLLSNNCLLAIAVTTGDLNRSPAIGAENKVQNWRIYT